jgi:hypothetical protein
MDQSEVKRSKVKVKGPSQRSTVRSNRLPGTAMAVQGMAIALFEAYRPRPGPRKSGGYGQGVANVTLDGA